MATTAPPAPVIPPVPTRVVMTNSDGRASRPWISWFNSIVNFFGFNQVVQGDGSAAPQEIVLNFLSPLTVTDNPANGSTDVGINLPMLPFAVQYGVSDPVPTGGVTGSVNVVFPDPFTSAPVVVCNPDNYPRGGNEPFACYPTNITVAGFTANFACSVPTGGGGAVITNTVHACWVAIGN